MIKRAAALAIAGLLLCACGTISESKAMTSWAKQGSYFANATTLLGDAKSSAVELGIPTSTHAQLNTVCSVLFVEAGQMQASLPTPDEQATTLLDRATKDLGAGAGECYDAQSSAPTRAAALKSLREGVAELSEASARIATASLP